MSQTPPLLTDRATLALHRTRATALFLQEEAALEVQERLIEVNRSFTAPVVVTGFPNLWPDFRCIADEETLKEANAIDEEKEYRAFIVAYADTVRLIDNMHLG